MGLQHCKVIAAIYQALGQLALMIALTCSTSNNLFIDNMRWCNCNSPRASTPESAQYCRDSCSTLCREGWSRIKPTVSYAMCSTTLLRRVSFDDLSPIERAQQCST
eukprot:4574-Heterococcus_DN1.PRE.1